MPGNQILGPQTLVPYIPNFEERNPSFTVKIEAISDFFHISIGKMSDFHFFTIFIEFPMKFCMF